METVVDKLEGPVTFTRDTLLLGMVAGDATVAGGARLELNGTVTGNLTIEDGAVVELRGRLAGALVNRGRCEVWGMIGGAIQDQHGETTLHPGADARV